jgi:predicted phosphodiesterase
MMGNISDSHEDLYNMLALVINMLVDKEKVDFITHHGDIFVEHINAPLFRHKPVALALTEDNYERREIGHVDEKKIHAPADNWTFTHPSRATDPDEFKSRIIDLSEIAKVKFRIYLGHKRLDDYFRGAESEFIKTLELIRRIYDSLRYFFAGHSHRQLLIKTLMIICLNPGAIQNSAGIFGGAEYSVIDTESGLIVFDRIPLRPSQKHKLNVGIISDTLDITKHDPSYWKNIRNVFKKYKVTDIIHCGNLDPDDIGRREFESFQVYYNPNRGISSGKDPENWHVLRETEYGNDTIPLTIGDYSFLIRLKLGAQMWDQSEFDMHRVTLQVKTEFPDTRIVLCGSTRQTFYDEGEQMAIINPGCTFPDQSYAIVELPRGRLTFGQIPLPTLAEAA